MTLILQFVAAYMGFLWEGAKFRIVGSEVATSNGGDALLFVESDNLRLRFVCDRRQLLLDFQPVNGPKAKEWFSVDLIRRLLVGQRESSAVLDESYAAFLREHIGEIERRFSGDDLYSTLQELRQLKQIRAKEMFG